MIVPNIVEESVAYQQNRKGEGMAEGQNCF